MYSHEMQISWGTNYVTENMYADRSCVFPLSASVLVNEIMCSR